MSSDILLELRKFVAPEFVFGNGAHALAGQYAQNLGAGKILLVTDPGVTAAGWTEQVEHNLQHSGMEVVRFEEISPNPRDTQVMAGAELYTAKGCDAIVALGGGSPMDCAKGIGIVSANRRHILEFEGVDKVDVACPPLICIPTTAGTSADVSQFAIITDSTRKVKIAIVSKTVVPDAALIDPLLTTTMDPLLTVCTGMDALTHAMEAYVSNASSPLTDLFALEAVRLIVDNLVPATQHLSDQSLRGKMMLGSLMAGMAFSNAILGAVHAMAHSLGGFLDLPHGECNAILLDHVMEANYASARERYHSLGRAMGIAVESLAEAERKEAILEAVRSLKRGAGMTRTLGELGVTPADIPVLAAKALSDACMVTNPCQLCQSDVEKIYHSAL